MKRNNKAQKGLTLVELMIGMLLGIIITTGAINVFINSVKGQSDNLNLTRLNQDLRAMMDIMVRDIRRAGFLTSDPVNNFDALKSNIFFGATTDIAVYDSGQCIVYSYNRDNDSPPVITVEAGSVGSNERLGFKLSGTALQMRRTGTTNADCSNTSWESISDDHIEITTLQFTLTTSPLNVTSMLTDTDGDGTMDGDGNGNTLCDVGEACNTCVNNGSAGDPACLYVRDVSINLVGRLASDVSVTQSISAQVRIRNDKFLDAIPAAP